MKFRGYIAVLATIAFSIQGVLADDSLFLVDHKQLDTRCNEAIEKAQKGISEVVTNPNDPTFANTVLKVEDILSEYDRTLSILIFLKDVSTESTVREAAESCQLRSNDFVIATFGRTDLFDRYKKFKESSKGQKLQGEDAKLLEDYYSTFVLNGLGISDPENKKKASTLIKEIAELEATFSRNLREDQRFILADKTEMTGMPEEWIRSLKKAKNGKYIITTQYPDYFPFMKNAKSSNARKRLDEQFQMRGGKQNVEILERILAKRHELAVMMGFANHAEKVLTLQGRMAQSTKEVQTFLDDLQASLEPRIRLDLQEMRRLKCAETKCKDWDQVSIDSWDWMYYINQLEKKVADLDSEKLKEYFPLEKVLEGMFDIYQTILSVEFERNENQKVWEPSVRAYTVRDKGSKEVLGTFYLDLFPRPGKYGHAGVSGLVKPKYLGNGKYQTPVAVMLCNFPKPTTEAPSLLRHMAFKGDVETLFHEFGHVMDAILTRTKYYSQGGSTTYSGRSGVPQDFVEAPSQMLENWVWAPEGIDKISGHFQTGEKLNARMTAQLMDLRKVASGFLNRRQIFLGKIDLAYHTDPIPNTTALWQKTWKDVVQIDLPSDTYPQASFGHIVGGYDAGYYSYLWAKVFAQDMFEAFEKNGILNPRTGMMYRKQILEPAGSRSLAVSLREFLRREPSREPFLKEIGASNPETNRDTKH